MKWRITAVCDVGSVRADNEDMVLVGEKVFRDGRLQGAVALDPGSPPYAVAVSDGMGGANAGEVASRIVLEDLRSGLAAIPPDLDEQALHRAIDELCGGIHRHVLDEGDADPARSGMGATLVALLHYGGRALFFSAGDSRLYRLRDTTLMQVSRDHSLRELQGAGAQAPSHVVLNSFGGGRDFHLDFGPAARKVLDDDVFLLCSDGLTDVLGDEEIEVILGTQGREDTLLAAALRRESQDNVTYILVEVSEAEVALTKAVAVERPQS
jgi:protein phosphatase